MKLNTVKKIILGAAFIGIFAFTQVSDKLTSNKTHVKFFSKTTAENIEANNYKAVSTIDTKTGDVVFSIPMQSFGFEKALMQKHFNTSKFLDTKKYPKAKLIAKITNLSAIKFDTDGDYKADVKGTLEMHGKTNAVNEKANINVKGKTITVTSDIKITLADYGIAFENGKPSTNIAKSVDVSTTAIYQNN